MNIVLKLFRPLFMFFLSPYLKYSKKCTISIWALLNKNTVLEGYNKVEEYTWISNSKIGYSSYFSRNCIADNCIIGRYCSIGERFIVISDNHPTDLFVTSHPAFYSTKKQSGYSYVDRNLFEEQKYFDSKNKIKVKVGNDVWIGQNVTIISGLEIGDGAIIATGAVVTKDVRPYSIVGGIPAKEIKRRFTDSQVDFLLDFKWWDKPLDWIKENAYLFQNINFFTEKLKSLK